MRTLELAWSRPLRHSDSRIARNIQAEAGAAFLSIIQTKDVQLKHLVLTDWIFVSKAGNCGKLLYSLANLLAYN